MFKPWKKFISSGGNKESLLAFLLESWSKINGCLLVEIQLYITSGKECQKLLSVHGCVTQEQVDQLSCDHEEADTRLMLHAVHAHAASWDCQTVLVKSSDTDVFILALLYVRSWLLDTISS